MVSYHPDSRFLTDFASANLPISEALCVSAHLEHCGKCRAHVQQLTELGGQLLSSLEPVAADENNDGFDRVMQCIEAQPAVDEDTRSDNAQYLATVSVTKTDTAFLPRALQRIATKGFQGLPWVQLGKSLRIAPVNFEGASSGDGRNGDQRPRQVSIYDIKAGGCMPEHEHRGEEITVLLTGSFSDADGKYVKGDFVVRNAGEHHQPTVTQDADCVCLVSLEAPVRPRSLLYRLFEPFVNYRLARATRLG